MKTIGKIYEFYKPILKQMKRELLELIYPNKSYRPFVSVNRYLEYNRLMYKAERYSYIQLDKWEFV